jgi:hypothetical protein
MLMGMADSGHNHKLQTMKKLLGLSLLLAFYFSMLQGQSIKSPDEFLGYPLGKKFTPHHQVVAYFRYVATALPQQVSLVEYGKTYEGRPLLMAAVSSAKHIARLEEIRLNNLRLAGLLRDKPADVSNAPTLVWLSYNVHGNEASSTEVSMKMLYELVSGKNTDAARYLEQTIALIDPCLNPDGRDRYVNWINSVQGAEVNPNPMAREHVEPWPGGRSNHYNFDLNRDWAWQSQQETQARIALYQRWMPQVHSDYHEQGYNNPYYFAPAAQPYHEAVTPFQRQFQTELGRNHARYFDQNGWLYFTREVFDLFYPAYGDTYPTYNGSVGMTFEQAGLGRASTAVITQEGDTLTLRDRIEHHYTTSLSTLELAAQHRERVMRAFQQFFADAQAAKGATYKTYVLPESGAAKWAGLIQLLERNGIVYGYQQDVSGLGLNYQTGKEERFTVPGALLISTEQPRGVLANVLFEPRSKLVDSATYDITAWSLPYAYGIPAFAVKERINFTPASTARPVTPTMLPSSSYGYLIPYHSFTQTKFLATLLKEGFRVRVADRDFTTEGKNFARGTLIVLRKGNEQLWTRFAELVRSLSVAVHPVKTGFMDTGFDFGSEKVRLVRAPRVAVLTGRGIAPEGAGEVWHLFDQQLQYPITVMHGEEFSPQQLSQFDVLILASGRYRFLTDKESSQQLRNWVSGGGKIIAMESAAAQLAAGDWGVKLKKSGDDKDDRSSYADVKAYAESEHDGIMSMIAGAVYQVELDDTHPLSFGIGKTYYSLRQDDNLYEFLKEGWNAGVIRQNALVAGFVGPRIKDKIKDAMVFGVQPIGRGNVIILNDNPLFRSFWENGKLLFGNALFLVN